MQVAAHDNAPEEFVAWLAEQIGAHKWIVARRSKARIKQGYDHFFTKRRFMALLAHYDKEHAEMTDSVSAHLTEPNMILARQRAETKMRQARREIHTRGNQHQKYFDRLDRAIARASA